MSEEEKKGNVSEAKALVDAASKIIAANSKTLTEAYAATLKFLTNLIKEGKTYPVLGVLGMMLVTDLLHGGAYAVNDSEIPFFNGNTGLYKAHFSFTGYPDGQSTDEINGDQNVPHIFPKLLSDGQYSAMATQFSHLNTLYDVSILGGAVNTFVEGATKAVKEVGSLVPEDGTD